MKNIFQDITIKYTRDQYLADEVTHQEYYSQFCGEFFTNLIKETMYEELDKLTSLDMSEIKISNWSGTAIMLMTHYRPPIDKLFESAGDITSQAGLVCLLKRSARIYLYKTKYFQSNDLDDLLEKVSSEYEMLRTLYMFYYNVPTCIHKEEHKQKAFEIYKHEIKILENNLTKIQVDTARIQALNILEITNRAINRQ
jgi:hypothetical protein